MSARNKARGRELEIEVRTAFENAGVPAKRIFGSGAYKEQLGEEYAADLRVGPPEFEKSVECKRKKSGFKFLYQAFEQDDADIVCVREDRGERLYIMKESTILGFFLKGENNDKS